MLTIRDLELKRTYIGGDYRKPKFQTVADVKIGTDYGNTAKVTLTDEQTDKAVEFILNLIRGSLTVEMEVPEPIEAPPPMPDPEPIDASEMEPL